MCKAIKFVLSSLVLRLRMHLNKIICICLLTASEKKRDLSLMECSAHRHFSAQLHVTVSDSRSEGIKVKCQASHSLWTPSFTLSSASTLQNYKGGPLAGGQEKFFTTDPLRPWRYWRNYWQNQNWQNQNHKSLLPYSMFQIIKTVCELKLKHGGVPYCIIKLFPSQVCLLVVSLALTTVHLRFKPNWADVSINFIILYFSSFLIHSK